MLYDRRVTRTLAAAVAAVIAVLAPDAAAQSRVGIVVRAGADPPVSPSEVGEAIEAVVGESATLRIEPRIRASGVLRERLKSFPRARQLAEEGWRAYKEVEPAFAESRLSQGRQRAAEVLDLQGGAELVAEISLRLGAVRLSRGRTSEAEDDFRLAAALDPNREVTTAEFRPNVVESFERARSASATPARLEIVAPAGAKVEVDGVDAGAAPVTVETTAGYHAVVVRGEAARPWSGIAVVPEGGDRLEVELEPDELAGALAHPLAVGTDETAAQLRVEARIIHGELDGFVLAAPIWRRGAPALIGQRCEGVPVMCTAVVEIGFASADDTRSVAAQLWTELAKAREALRFPPTLLEDARLTRGETRPGTNGVTRGSAWWKNKWLWVGVGAAALGAASYFVLSRDDETNTIIDVEPCQFGGICM